MSDTTTRGVRVEVKSAFVPERSAPACWSSTRSIAASSRGGPGIDADFVVTGFSRNEPLEGAITYSVTAKVNCDLRNPTWVN
mgnify:CR=1 FL=1